MKLLPGLFAQSAAAEQARWDEMYRNSPAYMDPNRPNKFEFDAQKWSGWGTANDKR
jgi:hypothetical protein